MRTTIRIRCIAMAVMFASVSVSSLAQNGTQDETAHRAVENVLDAHANRTAVHGNLRTTPLILLVTYFYMSPICARGIEVCEDGATLHYQYFYRKKYMGHGAKPRHSSEKLPALIAMLPEGSFTGPDVDKVIVSYYGGQKPWTRVYDRKRMPEAVLTLFDHYNLVIVPQVPRILAALDWEWKTVTRLAWPDELMSSDIDGSISRWDSTTGKLVKTVTRANDGQPVFMASDSLGRRIAYYTGNNKAVDVIDTTAREGIIKRVGGFKMEHKPTVMAFLEKSDLLFVGSKKESGIWNWTSRELVVTLPATSAIVSTDRTGGFAIAGRDCVHLYRSPDAASRGDSTVLKTEGVTFPQLVAAPRAGVIGYQVAPGKMRFFKPSTPDDHITIRPYPWPATCVAISPDARYLALRGPGVGSCLYLHDVRSGKPFAVLDNDRCPIQDAEYECVVFSPNGKNVAANSGGHIHIWRIPDADRN